MKTKRRNSVGQTDRTLQRMIVKMWQESGASKREISRACPTICTSSLSKYLNGDRTEYLRERSLEVIIAAIKGVK